MKRFIDTALAATLPHGVESNERGCGWSLYRPTHQPLPREGMGNG